MIRKTLRHFILCTCLGWGLGACTPVQTELGNLHVIPQPQEIIQDLQAHPFIIQKSVQIVYPADNEKLCQSANFLSASILQATGIHLNTTSKEIKTKAITLEIDKNLPHSEGYLLEITTDHIQLKGGSEAGVFYGIQTLLKAMPMTKNHPAIPAIPVGKVNDYPRFGYRGFMLDVGRHYFPIDYIKQVIDMLALHNINYFHWHLTEDQGWRIEIKKYPKLTEIGSIRPRTLLSWDTMEYDETPHSGFYTQEEAKEIVKYAADRYITVVPEIDMPGHMMAALVAYPELGCTGGPYEIPTQWGVFPDVLCGGNDNTLQFAKDVLNEIMDIFPSPYIHIGGDECPKEHWINCPKCQAKIRELGLKSTAKHSKENQLQTYFMGEVGKLIQARGRKMMGWDEMLEGGLAKDATIMSWTSPRPAIEVVRSKHDAILTPIQYLYFSNPTYNRIRGAKSLERVYTFEPVAKELTEAESKHVIGTQACLWTEWTRDSLKVEWQILPRMAALSEIQWTLPEKKNFHDFLKRLPNQLAIYQAKGWNYRQDIYEVAIHIIPSPEEGKAKVVLQTFDDAEIRYTLNGIEPSEQSLLYTDTIAIDDNATIQAVAIRSFGKSEVSREEIVFNEATMKPVTLHTPTHPSYTFTGETMLADGLYGDLNYQSGRWLGFHGEHLNAIIDLKETKEISSAFINTLWVPRDDIFGTTQFTVKVSENGHDFHQVGMQNIPIIGQDTPQQVKRIEIEFEKVTARYVQLIAQVTPELPQWHSRQGGKAFLFVDEIGVK
ncbi:MAG: beta-N-acetylhexosaminidase [Bacteroides sp.]|nr:beta-N-acetylhexosaminidase [Bacteroides sp.]